MIRAAAAVRVSVDARSRARSASFSVVFVLLALVGLLLLPSGCSQGPARLAEKDQITIGREFVEYPAGYELKPFVRNLTGPTSIAFDESGTIFIAEGGTDDDEPRIFAYKADGTRFDIYPTGRRIPLGLIKTGFRMYGPIGGIVTDNSTLYVCHRDENRKGVITAFHYDGSHETVVANLPAQGDNGLTDLAISPIDGRLYFGIGSATNSGVVGLDNWAVGWVRSYPKVCDQPYFQFKLLGYRFDTRNPLAGLFGGDSIAVTSPFLPFGVSKRTMIEAARNGRPGASVYSISPGGGDLRLDAHGIRLPRGLSFNEFGRLYVTNDGMELRGTRPVKDDPDALLRIIPGAGTWYGWPDYSTDLEPISDPRFQPPQELILKTGYPDLSFLIDHATSGLLRPDKNTLLQATFAPLSGAAKMDFVPTEGPFRAMGGSAIVAMSGDRAPFATSGQKMLGPTGYKIVRVDVDTRQVKDFIRNTQGQPISRLKKENTVGLERPVDVKFNPVDGAMYILDFGQMEVRNGKTDVKKGTGKIFKLVPATAEVPVGEATTQP